LGFSVEGVLRDEFWLEGQRLNVFYMGMLAEEFKGRAGAGMITRAAG
jgi:hypothetical protein